MAMPSSSEILGGLVSTANDWQIIAVGWHLLLGSLLLAMYGRWRPSRRLLGVLLSLPLASVSALAWWSGNVFNGAVFAAVSASVAGLGLRLTGRVVVGSGRLVVAGSALIAFGWLYPHFLAAGSALSYLYAAPLGVVPCPTLSAVIGIALVAGGTESRALAGTLAASGLCYGAIGALRLGVSIDFVLLGGAALLAVVALSQAAKRRESSLTSRYVGEA
jgi:hypothetical protein